MFDSHLQFRTDLFPSCISIEKNYEISLNMAGLIPLTLTFGPFFGILSMVSRRSTFKMLIVGFEIHQLRFSFNGPGRVYLKGKRSLQVGSKP